MSNNVTTVAPARYQCGWRKHAFRILAVMLSTGAACGFAELTLRAIGYSRSYVCPFGAFHKADPVLGWRGKPNFSGWWRAGDFDAFIVQTEHGFRKQEHRKEASQTQNTVFVLGDSFVWGWGTSQGENFADQMNLLMPTEQVENFGLAGTGTVAQYAIFEMHVQSRLRAGDTVLLAFFGNDFTDNVDRNHDGALHAEVRDGEVRLVPPLPGNWQTELVSQMKDWSYLFNFVAYCGDRYYDSRKRARMIGRRPTPPGGTASPPPVFSDDSPEVQVTRCYLEKFKNACSERQARLVIAYIPGHGELGEDEFCAMEDLSLPEQIGYRNAFFRCTDQLGIETIDLLPYLVEAKKTGRLDRATYPHDLHWNKNAHVVAAEAISAVLLREVAHVARRQRYD
jgi:hypothetical protein